jgi:hypothetical protein
MRPMTPRTATETGTPPRHAGPAPLAFKLLWYASRRRHVRMTTRAVAAMPTVADAREVA